MTEILENIRMVHTYILKIYNNPTWWINRKAEILKPCQKGGFIRDVEILKM